MVFIGTFFNAVDYDALNLRVHATANSKVEVEGLRLTNETFFFLILCCKNFNRYIIIVKYNLCLTGGGVDYRIFL